MICKGSFKFKGLQKRDGGKFINDKGEEILYKESYLLKLDESTDSGIFERVFKISMDSPLLKSLSSLELYEDVEVEFDLRMYGSRISLIPVSVK